MVAKIHPCIRGYQMKPTQHKPESMAAPQRILCPELLGNEQSLYTLVVDPWDTPSESDKHNPCHKTLAEINTPPHQDPSFPATIGQDGFPVHPLLVRIGLGVMSGMRV
ncbi:unnamed protein product [Staurois parvus]|uniref:Uncharacterized protein n=1 Tax=Staurois parvus TaxID=386267 RepID=A0ABN9B4C3_9NEOB|nr:unnamed protein product [Staurois parvus]